MAKDDQETEVPQRAVRESRRRYSLFQSGFLNIDLHCAVADPGCNAFRSWIEHLQPVNYFPHNRGPIL